MTPCLRYTRHMKLTRILLVGAAACAVSLSALAQWQWVDQSGRKVFSDRPPPPEIPEKNILRQGGKASPAPAEVRSESTEGVSKAASPASPQASGMDKELLEKKRKAEEAEAAKRKAEEEKAALVRRDNCERAQRGKANLDAGIRIFRTNAKGEREVLDDAGRAAELQRLQATMESECK